MNAEKKIIAICIATYKRPDLLKNCLKSIELLSIPENHIPVIIVADNDSEKSGEHCFNDVLKNSSLTFHYYVEPERGISSARNRLLKEALNHNASFIGFIDDDEFPQVDWLKNHMIVMNKFNADVVTGPVIPVDNHKPLGGKPISQKYNTGHTPRHIAAGNVLFKSKLVNEDGLWFDTKYNFTGGEDFHFFNRSSSKGRVHIWVEDAIVYEIIPEERRTKKYLFFRHFTGAINNVLQYKVNNNTISTWAHFLLKATGKIAGAIASAIVFFFTLNNEKLEKAIIKLASAMGYISGLLNIIVERYR